MYRVGKAIIYKKKSHPHQFVVFHLQVNNSEYQETV